MSFCACLCCFLPLVVIVGLFTVYYSSCDSFLAYGKGQKTVPLFLSLLIPRSLTSFWRRRFVYLLLLEESCMCMKVRTDSFSSNLLNLAYSDSFIFPGEPNLYTSFIAGRVLIFFYLIALANSDLYLVTIVSFIYYSLFTFYLLRPHLCFTTTFLHLFNSPIYGKR